MQDPLEGSWIQKSMLRVSTIYFPLPENTLYSGTLICESHQEVTNYQAFKHGRQAPKTNCEHIFPVQL